MMRRFENNGLDEALGRAGDGAFAVGDDGKIILWNRSAERILGYTARETLGRRCCDLFAGRDGDGNRLCYRGCHVSSLVKMGEPIQSFDMQTHSKSGQPLWLNISVLVTNGTAGDVSPISVHLFRDVTTSKELLRLVQEHLSPSKAIDESPPPIDLTRRELEILRLLANGGDTKAVADRLHVSPATVRNHVQNILNKLGVHSRLQAVAYATTHRLL